MFRHQWKLAHMSAGNCVVSVFFSPIFTYTENTHKNKRTQAVSLHEHTHAPTLCISIQPCRQQEEETLLPVEEWVEGAVVTVCTRLCVCVFPVYCEYVCVHTAVPSVFFYYCCLRGYWFISTHSVDTTGFGWSLKLPLGPDVDTTCCARFLTPVTLGVGGFRPWGPFLLATLLSHQQSEISVI